MAKKFNGRKSLNSIVIAMRWRKHSHTFLSLSPLNWFNSRQQEDIFSSLVLQQDTHMFIGCSDKFKCDNSFFACSNEIAHFKLCDFHVKRMDLIVGWSKNRE